MSNSDYEIVRRRRDGTILPGPLPEDATKDTSLSTQFLGQVGLPAFIITTFFPQLFNQLAKYPRLIRLLSLPLAMWIGWEFLATKVTTFWYKLMSNGMSSVSINSDDAALHAAFRRFLSSKKLVMMEREMSAQSTQYLRNQVQNGRVYERQLAEGKSIMFDPQNKYQFFWHNGRLFILTMGRSMKFIGAHDMTVWTFGWSPEPIRKLLFEAYEATLQQEGRVFTQILVPYSGRQWTTRCAKARRPMESVYLAEGQKEMLIKDIGEYLDDKTIRWYEARGIPHRRGYLFHGKPGCGKTTLALALAGHFNMQVYMLSLLDNDVTDNNLLLLFQSLRKGVLILLEDVDCAGVERARRPAGKTRPAPKNDTDDPASRVTLSGLLNAIDGAGAPEGHVLIMTTNKPDTLDEALVRAGRVDVRVEFGNATRLQVRDIFVNMYMPAVDAETAERETKEAEEESDPTKAEEQKQNDKALLAEIHALAEKFADRVPEGRFSPAELQDYILLHKNQPQNAADQVTAWVAEQTKVDDSKAESTSSGDSEDSLSSVEQVFSEPVSDAESLASSVFAGDEGESRRKKVTKVASKKSKKSASGPAMTTSEKSNGGAVTKKTMSALLDELKPRLNSEQVSAMLEGLKAHSSPEQLAAQKKFLQGFVGSEAKAEGKEAPAVEVSEG